MTMKTTISKSLLSVIIVLSLSLFMISCEESGESTSESYMMIDGKKYELNFGTFMLTTNDWGHGSITNWHDVALYSDGLNILENSWGGDSIVGDGAFMGFTVHPLDSTSIVGNFTFPVNEWVWDGTMATHGMPGVISPDTSIYFGDMKGGSTCNISLEGDIYTIEIEGYTMEWVNDGGTWSTDSSVFELYYKGTLEEEEYDY